MLSHKTVMLAALWLHCSAIAGTRLHPSRDRTRRVRPGGDRAGWHRRPGEWPVCETVALVANPLTNGDFWLKNLMTHKAISVYGVTSSSQRARGPPDAKRAAVPGDRGEDQP